MPDRKESIFVGALVTALLFTSYLGIINCLCCAGAIIGALVSVWHYTSSYEVTIPAGQGAVMGLAAAALGVFFSIFINYALSQIGLGANEAIMQQMLELYEGQLPPDQMDELRSQMQQEQSFGQQFLYGLISVVIAGIFGAVGGAIGASIFKKGGDESSASATNGATEPPPAV